MSNCDLKLSSEAWNDGVDAFKKAFLHSGGKTTASINFAIKEVQSKHPDFKFDPNTFTNPLISTLKEKGVIDEKYSYKGKKEKLDPTQKKIEKAAEKLKDIPVEKRKEFARKVYDSFSKDGTLTEQGVKNIYAEALGIPSVTEQLDELIEKTSKDMQAVDAIDARMKDVFNSIRQTKETNGKLTKEQDAGFEKQLIELDKERDSAVTEHIKSSTKFAEHLQDKGFWLYDYGDMIRMNLMNPVSLLKNITGAGFDAVIRNLSSAIASPISQFILKPIRGINSNPIGAKFRGAIKSKALLQAKRTFKYGSNDASTEMRRVSHINSVNQFRKALSSVGTTKAKHLLAATLKMSPDFVSRALAGPDAAVFDMVSTAELSRIAESKGLSGAEKLAFMMDPDEKSMEIANNAADKATFREKLPSWLEKINFKPKDFEALLIKKGYNPTMSKYVSGSLYIGSVLVFPFIKTPVNIVKSSSKILLPELTVVLSVVDATKETDPVQKQKILLEGLASAAVGIYVRNVALEMIAMGLISAGYSDEDKKTKDIVEQKAGGPNRINWMALVRGLSFQDMTERKTDKYIDLNSIGLLGIVMGSYAHAYNKYDKEDIKKQTQYTKDWSNAVTIPTKALLAEFAAVLDYTFFSGINQIERAIKSEKGHELDNYIVSSIGTIFTGIAPSTYQKISTQADPNVKKQFDKNLTLHENIANSLGYRFAFQSDELKNKYFSLSEDGKSGVKKKEYMFFDNHLGRVLQAEFGVFKSTSANVDSPIDRLYNAIKEVPKDQRDDLFPASISDEVSVGTRKNPLKIKLNEDQFGYLQEQASKYRMILATPFIMSDDFQNANHDTRAKVLQSFYSEGLKMAKTDMKTKFPEYRKQKMDIFEKEERNQVKKLSKKYKLKDSDI